jgi:glycosyltransferase involved in cell wall biosynthesis
VKSFSVLHIGKFYPPHNGGMETHLRDLAVRQTKTAQVKVIVSNSTSCEESSVIEGVNVTRVARIATIASMPVCPGLVSAIRSAPADIVHIHMPNPGAALAFLMSGHKGELVITHHADTLGRPFLRRFSDPFVRSLMRRASRILVTSNRYLDSSPELALFREKCRVIPLGIDIQNAIPIDREAILQVRQRFGENLILAIGRLVPYKGFDILIRAMKDVDAKLLLIGTGPQHEYLSRLITSENLEQKVAMLGRVDDVRPFLAAASIFVLPSVTRAEAFGIVQLEAMAAGLPVINTDIDSGVPEVCIDGETAITVPPSDPVALSEAMRILLNREELRARFGEAAKARVHSEYTNDLMAERTMSLYGEVLAIEHDAEQTRIPS